MLSRRRARAGQCRSGRCAAPSSPQGAELIAAKCFQCHTEAMWQDQRQDARAWEANLYRMVGRGALWTTEEIKLMADYLGTDFGPNVPPVQRRRADARNAAR